MLKYIFVSKNLDANETLTIWNHWGECDVKCGAGKRSRSRGLTILNQSNKLIDIERIDESCIMPTCPVHGGWGEWMYNEPTSIKKCGVTKSSKYRECDNPVAKDGGHECLGSKYYDVIHESFDCPIDGKWSAWSNYTHCDAPCNGGNKYRHRSCTHPHPYFGGNQCVGKSIEHKRCNENACQGNVQINFQIGLMDENLNKIDLRIVAAKLQKRIETIYQTSDIHSRKIKEIIIHNIKDVENGVIPKRQHKRVMSYESYVHLSKIKSVNSGNSVSSVNSIKGIDSPKSTI